MEDLLKVPLDVAVGLVAGVVSAMSGLKKAAKKVTGRDIPSKWKVPIVGILAFFGSLFWFQAKNALTWGNWLDIVAVTATTMFLAVLWHSSQKSKSDPRRQ